MRVAEKYQPLMVVAFFTCGGLVIGLVLALLRFVFEGGSFWSAISKLEAVVFMSFTSIILGIICCEIRALIKTKALASIIFGFISSQVFLGCLFLSSLVTDGIVKGLPDNMYLFGTLFFTVALSLIYFGTIDKNT